MANMSYCRYRNTLRDLDDCVNDLELRVFGTPEEDEDTGETLEMQPLSKEEAKAAYDLVMKALDMVRLFADNMGINEIDDLQDRIERKGLGIE